MGFNTPFNTFSRFWIKWQFWSHKVRRIELSIFQVGWQKWYWESTIVFVPYYNFFVILNKTKKNMSREWNIIHHLIIVKHLPLDAHNTHLTAFYKNVRRVTAVSSICNNEDVEIICWISQPNMACIIKYTYLCSSQNHVSFRTYSSTLPTRGRCSCMIQCAAILLFSKCFSFKLQIQLFYFFIKHVVS